MPGVGVALRLNPCLLPSRGRTLHGNVAKRSIELRQLWFAKIQNLPGEPPHSSTSLNKRKFRRTAEAAPHLGELSRQKTRKNGMNIHAGVVISESLRFCFAVIAVQRMVQALAHVIRERQRSEAPNALRQQFRERRHAPLAPAESATGSAWIFRQARSKTPCAASSKSTK